MGCEVDAAGATPEPPAVTEGAFGAPAHHGSPRAPEAGQGVPPAVRGSVPDIADGTVRHQDPAHIRAEAISWWITAAVVFFPGLIAIPIVWLSAEPDAWIMVLVTAVWLAAWVGFVLGALKWPRLAHRYTSYVLTPRALEIRRGVLWRSVTTVPRSRVQHTDVMQGPVMRKYGLAALTVYTAGTDHAVVTLPGLAHADAMRVREVLLRGGADDGV